MFATAASILDRPMRGDGSGNGLAGFVASAQRQAIDATETARWYLLLLGLGFSVWFGTGVVRALNVAFALAWGVHITKVRRPIRAGATFTAFALLVVAIGTGLNDSLQAVGLGAIGALISTLAVYAAAAYVIQSVFPHADAPGRALLPGCLLLTVGAVCVHAFVDLYLVPKVDRSVDTYGMLGAATVILLWLFIVARLLTVSAFLNATLWQHRNGVAPPAPPGPGRPLAEGERPG